MHATQRRDVHDPARPHRRPATALAALAAVLALLLIGASAAHADVLRRTSGADITINDAGAGPAAATPFPATVSVSNAPADRRVVGIRVKLDDVKHDYAADLDVALVSPDGDRVMLMSDVGGNSKLNGADLTFDDEAGVDAPGSALTTGTYRPTDDDQGAQDTMPAGAPADGYQSRLDAFEGANPNGTWSLYVVDDASGMAGTIGGWQLTLETGPVTSNSQQVLINDEGSGATAANPYPTSVQVNGVRGRVAEASVVLHELRHGDPDDIDIMLEGPAGKRTTLMSDAGGGLDIAGRTLRFDDDATDALDDAGQINSGTTMPVNFDGADTFPAPAPAQPDPATDKGLAEFAGIDPNGTWKLWVVDDADGEAGRIDAGWTLQLEIVPYVEFSPAVVTAGEGDGVQTLTVKRPEGGAAATVHHFVNRQHYEYDVAPAEGTLSFATGEKTKTFNATILDDTGHEGDEYLSTFVDQPTGDASLVQSNSYSAGNLVIEDDDAPNLRDDFNGDGRGDLAVGAPGEDVGTDGDAGAVSVIYGGMSRLEAAGNQRFTQDSASVPDSTEDGDRFGAAVASGDFNGDGFSDLAVGAPGEETANPADSGAVTILYGSASGLTGTGSTMLTQDSADVPSTNEAGDEFGTALAVGNFGRTAHADLAVGQPGEDVSAANGGGAFTVLYGAAAGLTGTGSQYFSQDVAGFPNTAETGDALGSALAAGDLGRGAQDDLAVGAPGEAAGAGVVHVLYGTPAGGIGLADTEQWSQDSPNVADGASAGDGFGSALAIGPRHNQLPGQLAVGAPAEDIGDATDAGVVHVLRSGEPGGVGSVDNELWAQSSGTVLDSPEDGDRFGAALVWGRFGTNGGYLSKSSKVIGPLREDLAVGVPGETLSGVQGVGGVALLYGDESLSGDGWLGDDKNQLWHQNSTDILGANQAGDHFGASVAATEVGGKTALSAGVPGEASGAGGVATIYGGTNNLMAAMGNQRWTQGADGLLDTSEAGDGFGAALAP